MEASHHSQSVCVWMKIEGKKIVAKFTQNWRTAPRSDAMNMSYRAARRCITKPKMVAVISTHSNLYSAVTPDFRSDSIFPGSKYAILIRKPNWDWEINAILLAHSIISIVWKRAAIDIG